MTRNHPPVDAWSFDRKALVALGRKLQPSYRNAAPFPHVVVDGLLGPTRAAALSRAFPSADHPRWKRRDYPEQSARLGQLQRSGFEGVAPELRWLLAELSGMAFLDFLGALTQRRDLIPDPHFTGAGLLATLPGGHLALHADFNRDPARRLGRVVTALYYLPRTWNEAWGGELELWDANLTRCEARIAPLPDRLVVMAHGDKYWHGHPSPLRCPEGHMRAVVAAYYYAAPASSAADDEAHGAIWA